MEVFVDESQIVILENSDGCVISNSSGEELIVELDSEVSEADNSSGVSGNVTPLPSSRSPEIWGDSAEDAMEDANKDLDPVIRPLESPSATPTDEPMEAETDDDMDEEEQQHSPEIIGDHDECDYDNAQPKKSKDEKLNMQPFVMLGLSVSNNGTKKGPDSSANLAVVDTVEVEDAISDNHDIGTLGPCNSEGLESRIDSKREEKVSEIEKSQQNKCNEDEGTPLSATGKCNDGSKEISIEVIDIASSDSEDYLDDDEDVIDLEVERIELTPEVAKDLFGDLTHSPVINNADIMERKGSTCLYNEKEITNNKNKQGKSVPFKTPISGTLVQSSDNNDQCIPSVQTPENPADKESDAETEIIKITPSPPTIECFTETSDLETSDYDTSDMEADEASTMDDSDDQLGPDVTSEVNTHECKTGIKPTTRRVADRKLEALVAPTLQAGKLLWVVKFKDRVSLDLVPAGLINRCFPQSVLRFMERRLKLGSHNNSRDLLTSKLLNSFNLSNSGVQMDG